MKIETGALSEQQRHAIAAHIITAHVENDDGVQAQREAAESARLKASLWATLAGPTITIGTGLLIGEAVVAALHALPPLALLLDVPAVLLAGVIFRRTAKAERARDTANAELEALRTSVRAAVTDEVSAEAIAKSLP